MKISIFTSLSIATSALALSGTAWAQQTPDTAQGAPQDTSTGTQGEIGEIIVTGSRIARQGFDAPTPTKVLGTEQLEARGSTDVGSFLNEIPAFRPSQNAQTNTQTSSAAGQTYADLRALGNIRTLVLVDGRRFVPSAATGQVDLNLIPTILVDRVEVVTGGASAAYGSDAISGVVNILLNKTLEGFKGDISGGISTYGDDWSRRISLAYGSSVGDGRGHFVIGGDYVKTDGVSGFDQRDWGIRDDEIVSFPANRAAGTPSRGYFPGASYTNSNAGGIINGACDTLTCTPGTLPLNSPLRGYQFVPGGGLAPFSYGNDIYNSGTAYDGTAPDGSPTRIGHQLVLPISRVTVMAHLDYDLTDDISFFAEASYARSGSHFNGPATRDTNTTTIVIRRDNAFLPPEAAALMDANGVQTISLGRHSIDYGQSHPDNFNTTTRFVTGLEGNIDGNWHWDGYFEYGRNQFDSVLSPVRINRNFAFAIDAVMVDGVPTCRALVPGSSTYNPVAAAGCVPLNLFGEGSADPEAVDYAYATQLQTITTKQYVGALNLRGNLFNTWAGPVAIAIGGEIRRDQAKSVVDPLSEDRLFNFGNPQPYEGAFTTKEGYLEALVPLAKDVPFAKSLDLNGAIRLTDYSSSGQVTTWKAGATWEPMDGLRFRGTLSRDIRAPNSAELFQTLQNNQTLRNSLPGPLNGRTAAYSTLTLASPDLQPEKADTKTGGIVLTPRGIPGLSISVDYYDIKVKGAISSYSPQQMVDNCASELGSPSGAGYFCSFIDRSEQNDLNLVRVPLVNLAQIKTNGVDFDVAYRRSMWGGSVTGHFYGSYVAHLTTDDGLGNAPRYNADGIIQSKGSVIDRAGQAGGFTSGTNTGATAVPHWQLNGSLTYANDLWSTTFVGRWIQGGVVDNTLVSPGDADYDPASPISAVGNHVNSRFYLNWSGSYNIINAGERKLQAYLVVNNVFNKDPPFPTTQVSGLFDRIGRFFEFGLRFQY